MCILKIGISNDIRILSNLNQEVQFRFQMPINSTAAPRVQKRLQALVRHSNMLAYLSSFINHTAPFHPPRKLKGCPM